MVTVKASQKIFTDSEVASLTGICVDHLRNFAKSRHLGIYCPSRRARGDSGGSMVVYAVRSDGSGYVVSALHTLNLR